MLHELRFYVTHSAEAVERLEDKASLDGFSQLDYETAIILAKAKLKAAKQLVKAYELFLSTEINLESFLQEKQ